MPYQIRITSEAEKDILDIFNYIVKKDSIEKVNYVLNKIEELTSSLDTHPERGNHSHELERKGIKEFRQVYFNLYRVIFSVVDKNVIIDICANGRRDMVRLLERRILR